MVDGDAERPLEVAAVEDQQPVKTLGAHGPDEALAIAFAFGDRTGVFTIRMPSLRKTSSKRPLYLLSRSRIRKRTPRAERSRAEAEFGYEVYSASMGRRVGRRQSVPPAKGRSRAVKSVFDIPQGWRFFVAWMCGTRSSERGAISWPCPS